MATTATDPAPGAQPAPSEASKLATDKALQEAVAARAVAETNAIKAEVEAIKARFGLGAAIGAGTGTNTVTLSTNAGSFEASFLAARQIDEAACHIVKTLTVKGLDPKKQEFVLFTGMQRPNLVDLTLFDVRRGAIDTARARAAVVLQTALDQGAQDHAAGLIAAPPAGPLTLTPPAPREAGMAPAAAAAVPGAAPAVAVNAALELASKLASYFQAEYAVTPAPVTGVDADLLAVAVAGQLDRAFYPAHWPIRPGSTDALLDTISATGADLAAERQQAEALLSRYVDAGKTTEAAKLAQLSSGTARAAEAVAVYATVGQAYDTLLNALTAADASGVPGILRLAEQMELVAAIKRGACVLMLQLGATAGTVFTKRSLWTFLGGMPVFVSGGVIASFLACDQTGAVRAAGHFSSSSGFRRLTSVGLTNGVSV